MSVGVLDAVCRVHRLLPAPGQGGGTPCASFTHRMRESGWAHRFAGRGLPGAYLRVLRTGSLQVGDPVEVLHRPGHGVSVAQVLLGDRSGSAALREAAAGGEVRAAAPMQPFVADQR